MARDGSEHTDQTGDENVLWVVYGGTGVLLCVWTILLLFSVISKRRTSAHATGQGRCWGITRTSRFSVLPIYDLLILGRAVLVLALSLPRA